MHQKRIHPEGYNDSLQLAYGECKCHRDVGQKGVPRAFVPWLKGSDNIDLFPHGFLHNRGCSITYHQTGKAVIATPKGRTVEMKFWGELPYLSKVDLQRVLEDLPEPHIEGTNGKTAEIPTAARASRSESSAAIKQSLRHLEPDMAKKKLANVRAKYKALPDNYYGGVSTPIGPEQ